MEITVQIVDRNYDQIKEFCEYNNIDIGEYIVQCVEDDFFTRKYGDLNEKLKKEEPKKVEEIKETETKPKVEKKKVGRPKKKVEEPKEEENVIEKAINNNNQVLIKKEEITETNNKPIKIKRTLKAK